MAKIVTGDQYFALDGQLHEIKRQLRQKGGYAFDPDQLHTALQALIEGRFSTVVGKPPSLVYAPELIPVGWEIAIINGVPQDVPPSEFDVATLSPRSFLRGGESYINCEEMRRRAVELKGNLGLSDGKRLLAEQDKIPSAFRDFYIMLPGTVLCDPHGILLVPYLYRSRSRGCWLLSFFQLGIYCYGRDRLACGE